VAARTSHPVQLKTFASTAARGLAAGCCTSLARMKPAFRNLLRAMFPKVMHTHALSHKHWSEVEEDLLPIVVDPERSAVDVGANVGSYTVALAKLARTVYAFEPDVELARLLRRAAPRNVHVSEDAVSERQGTSEFHTPLLDGRPAVALGSLVAPSDRDYDVRTVTTTTLNSALANANVGFIKIDVEGHEQGVLIGGRELIARCRPVVLVEANTVGSVTAVAAFFDTLGYAGFFVRDGRTFALAEFNPDMQDPELLEAPVPRRRMRFVNNFFFAPSDVSARIRDEVDKFMAGELSSPRSSPSP
jgi:FkbM family methyltransferase